MKEKHFQLGKKMKKEEILEKSRNENKNRDLYEQEVSKQSSTVAFIVMMILATVFLAAQIFTGGGTNYGFHAVVFSGLMAAYWVKWLKLRQRLDLIVALAYTIVVLMASAAHLYNLITASTIL